MAVLNGCVIIYKYVVKHIKLLAHVKNHNYICVNKNHSMENGTVCLLRTGEVRGRKWRDSNYCVGILYKGNWFSDDIFEQDMRNIPSVDLNITEYVRDYITTDWVKELDEEIINYLES